MLLRDVLQPVHALADFSAALAGVIGMLAARAAGRIGLVAVVSAREQSADQKDRPRTVMAIMGKTLRKLAQPW